MKRRKEKRGVEGRKGERLSRSASLRRRQRRRVRTEEAFTKIGTQVVAKILNTLKKDCESRLFATAR